VFHDTASALFGVAGLRVTDVEAGADGAVEVWAVTDCEGAAACPECGELSSRVHDIVVTCPADVRRAGDKVALSWVKRRLKCGNAGCPRKTFTERVPAVAPGGRVTGRLLESVAAEVADRGITESEAARHAGVSWPVAHGAFAAMADELLGAPPAPVAHLGIDEHRRGRPRWRLDAVTGQYEQLADRWHVVFCDLSGGQGMLGQVEGRTADDAAYWLLQAPQDWRDSVEVVAIDMCTIFLSAVRRALPRAKVAVDLFHVVQLAVKAVDDVRRRAAREKYGRRGKEGDPEYGVKGLLKRNAESLSPEHFAKVIETLDADGHGQQVLLAWIAKEKLRAALRLRARIRRSQPTERQVRGRLFAFYDWCARHDAIPELATLASTISRWEEQIVTAVLTGVTNAATESLNRPAAITQRNQAPQTIRIQATTSSRLTSKAHQRQRQANPRRPFIQREEFSRTHGVSPPVMISVSSLAGSIWRMTSRQRPQGASTYSVPSSERSTFALLRLMHLR
jgi:transposase